MRTGRQIKQQYIKFYLDGGLPLFRDGEPNRGSSGRCAFWDGYSGIKNITHTGIAAYQYAAGQYCAKHHKSI